jgi:AraC-like DNA-binding protein
MTSDQSSKKSAKSTCASEGALVLGDGLGTFRKRAVLPPLRQHFIGAWFHTVPMNASGPTAVIPDGCADLVWCRGTLRVAGPCRRVKFEAVPPGTSVVGLQFQPGAALPWFRTPVSGIVDARVPLESFWGPEARYLSEWIGEAETPNAIAHRLEIGLTRRLPSLTSMDALPPAIFRTVRNRRDYSIAVTQQLCTAFGLSERTLRRRCYEAFGYGPKTLDRILRFQRFLQLARTPGSSATAHLASDTGYADQAHLIREARILAGMTPGAIREELSLRSACHGRHDDSSVPELTPENQDA